MLSLDAELEELLTEEAALQAELGALEEEERALNARASVEAVTSRRRWLDFNDVSKRSQLAQDVLASNESRSARFQGTVR